MMDLLNYLNDVLLRLSDPFFSWVLLLPRDIALVIISVLTSLIMILVRKWTTDQDVLRRCSEDKKRLKQMIKEAKQRQDKQAVKRHRSTIGMIGLKTMMSELKPLLWVIVPIAILGTWAFNRMGYFAPQEGEAVELIAYFPVSDSGDLVYLIPESGLELAAEEAAGVDGSAAPANAWIKEITVQALTDEQKAARLMPDGVAHWRIKAASAKDLYTLTFRHNEHVYTMDYLVGGDKYAPTFTVFSDTGLVPSVEVQLEEYKPLGVLPGILMLMCPAWLVGYMLIAVPMVFILKPVLRIY